MDEGISGRNTKKRTAFNAMIGLAKRKPKPFDVILVWKYSRFARNREDSVVYKSMLRKELDIDVISISEDVGDDKMSILFEAMIEAMDEYYSINLAEEVKRGMTEKAKRGGVLSIAGYGYRVENGEYVIVSEEAEIIRKVFNDYANGNGYLTIAKALNAMGIKSHKGKPIEKRTIEYWLNNPVYIGKTRWNPDGKLSRKYGADKAIITDGTHSPIIDMETWSRVQEQIRLRKTMYQKYYNSCRKELSHWLAGVVRCEKCGAVLSNQGGFFGCSNRCRGLSKSFGYIKAEKLDNIVLDTLSDIMLPNVEFFFAEPDLPQDTSAEDECKIIYTQIQKLDIRLERVKSAYEEGVDTLEEYKINKKTIIKEINNLKNLLKECKHDKSAESVNKSDEIIIHRLMDILKNQNVNNVEKNKVARTIFKEITKGGSDGKQLKIVFRKGNFFSNICSTLHHTVL